MKLNLHIIKNAIQELLQTQPFLFFLIIVFSLYPFYVDHLNGLKSSTGLLWEFLLGTSLLQVYLLRQSSKRILGSSLAMLTFIGLTTVYQWATSYGAEMLVFNISALWAFAALTIYFTSTGPKYIGAIISRLKRLLIASISAFLFNLVITITLVFAMLILESTTLLSDTLIRCIVAGNIGIVTILICTYDRWSEEIDAPSTFFTIVFGEIIPKASILTGVLANMYLFLMLIGVREDTRFLYTYYPYVALFYLFYLASFRIRESSLTQRIVCSLFIVLTTICLCLIGKRAINDPYLWLNSIYLIAINGIFLIYNIYTLINQKAPNLLTSYMAMALGVVLFMPTIGYSSFYTFTTYNQVGATWEPKFSIAEQFTKTKEDINNEKKQYAYEKNFEQNKERDVVLRASNSHMPLPIQNYSYYIANVSLKVEALSNNNTPVDPTQSDEIILGTHTIILSEKGHVLTVVNEGGTSDIYQIHQLVEAQADEDQPLILTGKDYSIFIFGYFISYPDRRVSFEFAY